MTQIHRPTETDHPQDQGVQDQDVTDPAIAQSFLKGQEIESDTQEVGSLKKGSREPRGTLEGLSQYWGSQEGQGDGVIQILT